MSNQSSKKIKDSLITDVHFSKSLLKALIIDSRLYRHKILSAKDTEILKLIFDEELSTIGLANKLNIDELEVKKQVQKTLEQINKTVYDLFENYKRNQYLFEENLKLKAFLSAHNLAFQFDSSNEIKKDFGRIPKIVLSKRAQSALEQIGISKLTDLKSEHRELLIQLPKIGKKTLTEIMDAADEFGIQW
jgi:DNA-directed RNA polymerase alpha subunit